MRLFSALAGLLSLVLALPAVAQEAVAEPAAAEPAPAPVETTEAAQPAEAAAPVSTTPQLTAPDLEAWMDGYLPYALQRGDIAGAVVVVVKDGQVLLQKGYGYADVAARTPVDPATTLFRPGSVSKLFTWTAVMQLVEQGKLDLDADVNTYLDFEVPARDGQPVTLRNVMTHTTGMEEQIRGLITDKPEEIVPLGPALKYWVPERIFAPGGTPAYSNYATALAGYIVERVSGQSFDDYIDQHVFAPLGMQHASFRQPLRPELAALMSRGYETASDGKPKDYEFISLAPAGSLAASGSDMAKFMIAHLQDGAGLLKPETAELMHGTGQASVGPLNRMMLGFYETSTNGHRAIAHGGDTQWFHSDLQLFPDDGIGIFVSVNSSGREGAPGKIRGYLTQAFADRYLPGPAAGGTGEAVDEATAKEHAQLMAGNYESSRRPDSNFMSIVNLLGQVQVVANEDGTISVPMLTAHGGAPRKWREISPWLWQDVDGGERLAADVVDGQVLRFSAEPLAAIMVFQRLPWWKSSALLLPLLGLSLFVLLATVVAWPVSALVRRHYGVPYRLGGADARAHRRIRWTALAVSATVLGSFGLVIAMMSDLNLLSPASDIYVNLMRIVATVVLPVGALLALANAAHVLRARRRLSAKIWAVAIALSCLFLLWIGFQAHLLGFGAYY